MDICKTTKTGTINISLSREHAQYAPEIKKCFKGLELSIDSSYMRLSEGELPMQILIFLGGSVVGGAFWDLLKMGIKKVFSKFKNARINVHDKQSIPFVVFPDGRVKAIVIPDREKEFLQIKNIDDLILHLEEKPAVSKQGSDQKRWKTVKLGDVAEIQNGFAFKSKDFGTKGIPVIKIKNIASGKLNMTDVQSYDGPIDNLRRYILSKGDILVSMTGSHITQMSSAVGKVAKYDLDERTLLNQRVGKIVPNESLIDQEYLYYLVSRPEVQYFWGNRAGGSANQANISPSTIKSLSFELPPLEEQKRIAYILSTFDKKIELLQKQNKTLEAIAQTLYKRWFVDFEFPNEDGKPYKSSGGKMMSSELGEIPEGWEVGKLGEALELSYGKGLKTEDRTGDGFPVYGSNGVVGFHDKFLVVGPGIIVGRKGTIGTVTWCDDNFFPIDTTFFIEDKLGLRDLYYHYFLLKRQDFNKLSSDSAVPGLNRNSVYLIDIFIPPSNLIGEFSMIASSLFEKIRNNNSEIRTLTLLRDNLLSKLLNNQIAHKN